jgi:hypothetical protein
MIKGAKSAGFGYSQALQRGKFFRRVREAVLVKNSLDLYGMDPINDFANICNGEGPRNVPRHNGRPYCSQVRFAVGRLMLVGARGCEGVLGS